MKSAENPLISPDCTEETALKYSNYCVNFTQSNTSDPPSLSPEDPLLIIYPTIMRAVILITGLITAGFALKAQPAVTPAEGYHWVLTGSGSFDPPQVSTIPNITSGNTNFGQTDVDPSNCAAHCAGNCDGQSRFGVSMYGIGGTFPTGTNSNCEQRAIILPHWNNPFPQSAIAAGASTGTVYLPTGAIVSMLKSPVNLTPGCGAGATNSTGKVFGGNGTGNFTKANISYNYNIAWSSTEFGGIVNGQSSWTQTGSFTAEEPGSGNYSAEQAWYSGSFGNTLAADVSYNIPSASVPQTGGNFEIVVTSSPEISITREFGNADAFAETEPGMEGLAAYQVNYGIWELQQNLPLKLTRFTAQKLNNGMAILNWTNATESGNNQYEVERSYNGRNWEKIGQIQAVSQEGRPADYQFTDRFLNQAASVAYYRLRLVELGGTIVYSNQLLLRSNRSNACSLVPMASKNNFLLQSPEKGMHEILIRNVSGQLVAHYRLAPGNNATFALTQIPAGLYWASIQNTTGTNTQTIWVAP